MIFINQDLSPMLALSFCGAAIPRSSQWEELGDMCVDVIVYGRAYMHISPPPIPHQYHRAHSVFLFSSFLFVVLLFVIGKHDHDYLYLLILLIFPHMPSFFFSYNCPTNLTSILFYPTLTPAPCMSHYHP